MDLDEQHNLLASRVAELLETYRVEERFSELQSQENLYLSTKVEELRVSRNWSHQQMAARLREIFWPQGWGHLLTENGYIKPLVELYVRKVMEMPDQEQATTLRKWINEILKKI